MGERSSRVWIAGFWLVLIGVAVLIAGYRVLFPSTPGRTTQTQTVVLYSSVDDVLVRSVVEDLEARTGLTIQLVGDTEATKTTGLVGRLIAEGDRPRADVWWSSEAMGTVRLVQAGVLTPHEPADTGFADGWPAGWRDAQGRWFAFASRARVIAFASDRVPEPPTTLRELVTERYTGRVGMARPQFGTTRGHMALLVEQWGADEFEAWLTAMRRNGLRLYDGNATVVQAIARGEIMIGLTDTDDVYAGQRNGWRVDFVYETIDGEDAGHRWPSAGPMLVPNTAGLVKDGPNPTGGAVLLDAILSADTERLIAASDSRNTPMRPPVAAEFPQLAIPTTPAGDPAPLAARIAALADEAMAICERVLAGL